jgi:tetratricopeptide (TPR) repeat protein
LFHHISQLQGRLKLNGEKFEEQLAEPEISIEAQLKQARHLEVLAQDHIENTELDKAIHAYMQALGIYEQIEDPFKVADTLTSIGLTYNSKGELDKAILSFDKSLEIYENQGHNEVEKARVLYHTANAYHDIGELDKSLHYWECALPLFQTADLTFETASTIRHIGFIYQDQQDERSIEYFKRAIPLFEKLNSTIDLANLNYSLGLVHNSRNEVDKSIEYYYKALILYKQTDNPYDEAETLYSLCLAYKAKGDLKTAIDYYVQALSLYEHNPSLINKVGSLREIGVNYFTEQDLNEALKEDIESFRQMEKSNNPIVRATAYQNIALSFKTKGDLKSAFNYNQKALTIYEEENQNEKQGQILQNLGLISHKINELDQALEYYNKAITLLDKNGNTIDLVYVYTGIGNIYLTKGLPNSSIEYYEKGLELLEDNEDFLGKATILTGLGNSYRSKGELVRALEMYIQSLSLYEKSSNPMDEASTLFFLGETYFIKGQFDVALEKYERAMHIFDQSQNSIDKARVLTGIGNVHRIQGSVMESIDRYLEAIELFEGRDAPEKAHTLKNIAEAYIIQKQYDEAVKYIIQSIAILKKSPNPLNMAIPLNKLGKVYYARGETEKAFHFCAQAAELFVTSPNPLDIYKPLDEIYHHEPRKAISLALSSPLGINWYLNTTNQIIADGNPITADNWFNLWSASGNWWDDIASKVSNENLSSSIYYRNWRIKFLLEEVQRNITSETTLNYLFGANDIETNKRRNYKELRNVQELLNPMWIVEIPTKLLHGERYLKIRLNNLIKRKGEFTSYPSINKQKNPAIARIRLNIETQWLQQLKVDHIFYPNSEIEHKSFQLNPENTWLKDVVIMDLGENLKKENNLELLYSIEIYYDKNSFLADVKTTSKRITIPVIRTNNFQELEKFKENHANSLAVFIALWSIFFATLPYLIDYNTLLFSNFNFPKFLAIVSITVGISLFLIFLGIKAKNKDKITDSLQRSSIGIETDSIITKFIPQEDMINLDQIEFDYSVDLQDSIMQEDDLDTTE